MDVASLCLQNNESTSQYLTPPSEESSTKSPSEPELSSNRLPFSYPSEHPSYLDRSSAQNKIEAYLPHPPPHPRFSPHREYHHLSTHHHHSQQQHNSLRTSDIELERILDEVHETCQIIMKYGNCLKKELSMDFRVAGNNNGTAGANSFANQNPLLKLGSEEYSNGGFGQPNELMASYLLGTIKMHAQMLIKRVAVLEDLPKKRLYSTTLASTSAPSGASSVGAGYGVAFKATLLNSQVGGFPQNNNIPMLPKVASRENRIPFVGGGSGGGGGGGGSSGYQAITGNDLAKGTMLIPPLSTTASSDALRNPINGNSRFSFPELSSVLTNTSSTINTLSTTSNKSTSSSSNSNNKRCLILSEHKPSNVYRKRNKSTAPLTGRCHSCNISDTPEWRCGPDGARTLCNACGLHYAKMQKKRASKKDLNSEVVKSSAKT